MFWTMLGLCVCAYFVGAIPFGKWIAASHGVNILEQGSRNIGATNVWRTLGPKAGVPVFVLDAAKGYVPSLVGGYAAVLFGRGTQVEPAMALLVGFCAVLGHSLSIFLGFRGGKSVATALGVVLAISPLVAALSFGTFFVLFFLTKYVSLSSIIGTAAAPVLAAVFRYPILVVAAYSVLALLIIYRHKANILRLLSGTEYKFGDKREREAQAQTLAEPEDERVIAGVDGQND